MLRLLTFGGLGIDADNGSAAPRLGPPRLALLAVLAAAGDRGVTREKLSGLFWPDSDEEHARHSLRQALYAVRSSLGSDAVRSAGSKLMLDTNVLTADVADVLTALNAGDRERAVSLARGTFLDGFYLQGYPAFERWVEEERNRLAAAMASTLLSLASDASRAKQHDAAVEWWYLLTQRDPLSGRFALGYLKALAARGDRAEALAFARRHEAVVRRELEADPDPEIRRLEVELRAMPMPGEVRSGNGHAAGKGLGNGNGHGGGHVLSAEPGPDDPVVPVVATVAGELMQPLALPNAGEVVGAAAKPKVRRWRVGALVTLVAVLALTVSVQRGWFSRETANAIYAVGFIREDVTGDSPGSNRVLTDMIATNLARVEGLSVLANSRLLELMQPGRDSASGYADAARRAGATELLEGQLVAHPRAPLQLEVRRVDMRTGIVKAVYRVSASDRGALVDSITRVIARGFSLPSPSSSIAAVTTSSGTAYRLYVAGLRAFYQNDIRASQRLMHAALVEDSTFAMAWYYLDKLHWLIADPLLEGKAREPRQRALEYAARLPERERLTITADLLGLNNEDPALAMAETLATKYPSDPRSHFVLGKVRVERGDWTGAVAATERAIALDSSAGRPDSTICRLCEDFVQLADVYLWWDSLSAVTRTAQRYHAAFPDRSQPFFYLGLAAERAGDSAAAYTNFRQLAERGGMTSGWTTSVLLVFEKYDEFERQVRPVLESAAPEEQESASWDYLLVLRNQGRMREAELLNRTGSLPGLPANGRRHVPQVHNEGILALARGRPREAARVFTQLRTSDMSGDPPGIQARVRAWSGTLQGMALAAGGDTAAVRALADSVERWGAASAYGRDRKSHHYLRGLLLAAEDRHDDAVREFRAAIHSPSLGFTRVNYELARSLLRLGRPTEAISTLQAALRGELYASNLYVTHSELHELLAQAFDAAGQVDSAAFHYRAVVKAWQRADPEFVPRREAARSWLARNQRTVAEFSSARGR